MNNYKIKVNNESESREAQELFFELGYKFEFSADFQSFKQSEAFSFPYFVQATEFGQIIFAIGQLEKAKELTLHQLRYLVAQIKNEQGLISGADALRALADGKEVERKLGIGWCNDVKKMPAETILHGVSELRLKPRTITLNVEIPAPFEPKEGDMVWCLDGNTLNGYKKVICDDFIDSGIGFWRNEEEIRQVVAALRGGIKA